MPAYFHTMTEFQLYLSFGFGHILHIQAYDHILFIATLVAAYPATFWKRMILLVTAFTVGHSVTLALAALGVFRLDQGLTEVFIAGTILIAASYNLFQAKNPDSEKPRILTHYFIALFFGLIHGLGFAGQFRDLLGSGGELITALFAFNIGVELGQIIVIVCLLLILWIFISLFRIRHNVLRMVISIIAAVIAIVLIVQRITSL